MAALCDILGCGIEDLVTVTATDVRRRKATSSTAAAAPNVVELNKSVRPGRARVIREISPQRRSTMRSRPQVTDGLF